MKEAGVQCPAHRTVFCRPGGIGIALDPVLGLIVGGNLSFFFLFSSFIFFFLGLRAIFLVSGVSFGGLLRSVRGPSCDLPSRLKIPILNEVD